MSNQKKQKLYLLQLWNQQSPWMNKIWKMNFYRRDHFASANSLKFHYSHLMRGTNDMLHVFWIFRNTSLKKITFAFFSSFSLLKFFNDLSLLKMLNNTNQIVCPSSTLPMKRLTPYNLACIFHWHNFEYVGNTIFLQNTTSIG